MQAEAAIEINNFSFSYDGKNDVFRHLSLNIEKGSIHGILGPNGAGKSTLFNSIFEHEKFKDIFIADGYEKEIAFLQAEPYHYPYMTGLEYIKVLSRLKNEKEVLLWNEIFQLPLDKYVHNYSTGMKKKISLLGIVLLNKKILLLDEPTNGLDLESTEFFKILIERLRQLGVTIVLSSHILESLFTSCDRITLMKGRERDGAATYEKTDFETLGKVIHSDYNHQKQSILEQLLPIIK